MNQAAYRVLLLDTKHINPNHYMCIGVERALRRHPRVEVVVNANALNAIALAREMRCNVLLAFDGEELRTDTVARVKSICGLGVLWVSEDPYELHKNVVNARLFDLVFTNEESCLSAYGAKGRFLPLAGTHDFHSMRVADRSKSLLYDVFFAGTIWPNRAEFFREIVGSSDDLKFKLALPANRFLPPHRLPLPDSQISWRCSPPNFARFANRSVATILLPRVFSSVEGQAESHTPPPRVFEAALAGTVQLVPQSMTELSAYFTPDEHFQYFADSGDFLRKVRALKADRGYRDSIAEAARRHALEMHCYENRIDTIISELDGLRQAADENATSSVTPLSRKKNVLFVCHNIVARGGFGGVEVYLDQIRLQLLPQCNVFFYVPAEGSARSNSTVLLDADYQKIQEFKFGNLDPLLAISDDERENAFHNVLCEREIDLVHFQHFIGHVPSLVYVARALGVRTVFTMHDYYPVCVEFNLISFKNAYCHAPDIPISQCDVCLAEKRGLPVGSQSTRRNFWAAVLNKCDRLIFNTASGRDLVLRIYPELANHRGLRILPVPISHREPANEKKGGGRLKVALLGNVTMQKGGDVLLRVIRTLRDAAIMFYVFGRIDDPYLSLADENAFPNVKVTGTFSPGNPPAELAECHVSLHVSVWPETYCLTLSEAWQQLLVPIVTDIGALGERVEHGVDGLKIPPQEEGALRDAIMFLAEDRGALSRMQATIKDRRDVKISTMTPHVRDLLLEYEMLTRDVPALGHETVGPSTGMSIGDLGISLQSRSWVADGGSIPRLQALSKVGITSDRVRRLIAIQRREGYMAVGKIIWNVAKRKVTSR